MYTLRKVNQELGTFDQALGQCYNRVNRFENKKRFREYFKEVFRKDHVADLDTAVDEDTKNTIGFVITSNDYIIPIDQRDDNYIVTETGKTLVRLNKSMTRRGQA